MTKAIFIDRDGTIGGSDTVEYPGEFQLFPFVEEAITKLKQSGYLILSFTNQPGVSKREATKEDYDEELLGFGFDKVYLCPHQYKEGCECRKPATGMLIQAKQEYHLNLDECIVIGDRWTDMIAADEVECIKILVRTGAGEGDYKKYQNNEYYGKWATICPDFIADNFLTAVNWILSN